MSSCLCCGATFYALLWVGFFLTYQFAYLPRTRDHDVFQSTNAIVKDAFAKQSRCQHEHCYWTTDDSGRSIRKCDTQWHTCYLCALDLEYLQPSEAEAAAARGPFRAQLDTDYRNDDSEVLLEL